MRSSHSIFAAGSICLALAAVAGCKHSPTPTPPPAAESYDIRGIIEKLPTPAAPHELTVHTETSKGMEAMTMTYTLGQDVSLTNLSVGEKVSLHVETDRSGTERVTEVTKLPAHTKLKIPATTATAPAETMKAMPGM